MSARQKPFAVEKAKLISNGIDIAYGLNALLRTAVKANMHTLQEFDTFRVGVEEAAAAIDRALSPLLEYAGEMVRHAEGQQ